MWLSSHRETCWSRIRRWIVRNFQILIVFAAKVCKQRMQTASTSRKLCPPRLPTGTAASPWTLAAVCNCLYDSCEPHFDFWGGGENTFLHILCYTFVCELFYLIVTRAAQILPFFKLNGFCTLYWLCGRVALPYKVQHWTTWTPQGDFRSLRPLGHSPSNENSWGRYWI